MSRMMMMGAGGPLSTAFTPADLSNLAAWYRTDLGAVSDSAAQFTSANLEYLSISDNASLSTGDIDYFVACNAYLDDKANFRTFMSKGTSGDLEYWLGYDTSNRIVFTVYSGNSVRGTVSANTFGSVPTGIYMNIMAYHDAVNNQVGISINGGTFDTAATTGAASDSAGAFEIGRGQGLYHNGRIDSAVFGKSPSGGISAIKTAIRDSFYNSGLGKQYNDITSSEKTDWGMVSWWDLDEESGTRRDAHGTNHLTDNNTVTTAPGIEGALARDINYAAQFTAANAEHLGINDNASLSTGDIDFTLAGWVYFDAVPSSGNDYGIMGKWLAGAGTREYLLYAFNSGGTTKFAFTVRNTADSGDANVTANNFGAVSANNWYYVVAWHDATANTINISVNNSTADSAAHSGGVYDGAQSFDIGRYSLGSYFHGKIDSASFWKRTLTSAEKTWLYNVNRGRKYAEIGIANTAGSDLTTNLIAWWNLDEASGTRNDSHGTNHLTDNNTVTQGEGVDYYGGLVSCWYDQSANNYHLTMSTRANRPLMRRAFQNSQNTIQFDGTNDNFAFPTTVLSPRTNSLSVFFVANSENTAVEGPYLSTDESNSIGQFRANNTLGKAQIFMRDGGGSTSLVSTSTTSINGAWHQASLIWDLTNEQTTVRVNGTQEDQDTNTSIDSATVGPAFSRAFVTTRSGSPFFGYFKGYTGDWFVCNAVVSGTDLSNSENYLETKFGTP